MRERGKERDDERDREGERDDEREGKGETTREIGGEGETTREKGRERETMRENQKENEIDPYPDTAMLDESSNQGLMRFELSPPSKTRLRMSKKL